MVRIKMLVFILLSIQIAPNAADQTFPKPTQVKVSERTRTSFRIEWKNPIEQEYERFNVAISPDAVMQQVTSARQMSRSFSSLKPAERYTVFIKGFTSDGFPSSVLKYEVWSVPDTPTGIQLKPIQEITISISMMGRETSFTAFVDGLEVEWDENTENQIVSGYDLQITPDEGVIVESDHEEFSDKIKKIFTGLTPGQEYTVKLRSRVGPDYDPVYSSAVTSVMRLPPAVPYSVEVVETQPTSVVLKTHGPLEGIHDDLKFFMSPKHGSMGKPSPDPIYPMFDLYPVKGLKPGTTYRTEVFALSKSVQGVKPYVITFSTTPAPPIKLRTVNFDHYSVTLRWNHAHKFMEFDEVQYLVQNNKIDGGEVHSAIVKNLKSETQMEVIVHELIPGTVYEFRVYTILNGVKSTTPAEVIQTTIPKKPTIVGFRLGNRKGVTMMFGKPKEGKCPSVKVFYSPSLTGDSVTPTFHSLQEEIMFEEIPTDGRYTIHARCVSRNVEGPELVLSTVSEMANFTTDISSDRPTVRPRLLPCMPAPSGNVTKADTVAPDACCNMRPYHTAMKECCGEYLLETPGDRLCCLDSVYNKRFSVCCPGNVIRGILEGCEIKTITEE